MVSLPLSVLCVKVCLLEWPLPIMIVMCFVTTCRCQRAILLHLQNACEM